MKTRQQQKSEAKLIKEVLLCCMLKILQMNSEIIVVGAGISGLSAAKWLKENGINVLVLEARDRVGGRTWTKCNPNVNYVDMGGSYIGPTQDRILRMAKELEIENYKVNEKEDLFYYRNGRRSRFSPNDLPSWRNPFFNMDLNNLAWLIDEMGKEIPADAPWDAPHADEWDTMTWKEFLQKNCWTKCCIDYFRYFININITSEAYESSLLSFLWYIKQCGGVKRTSSTTNGAQERKFVGGSQQISEKIAERLGENAVLMNDPVVGICQESKEVLVKTLNGKEYKTNYVILALPPILQMKIHFSPPLPPLRNQLNQRMPIGTVMKVILYYRTTFWKEKDCCGNIFIEGGDEHPMFMTQDDTKHDGSFPALVGFVLADKCRRIVHLTANDRKHILAKSIYEATGFSEALKPIHYEEKNWMEEQYSGGCYTALYPPGLFTRYGRVLREPVGKIYYAGTETAVKWSGYMDGAVEAGERAAREVLHNMGRIPRDQIWLQEPPSEEVPALPFKTTFREKYLPSVPGFLKLMSFSTILGAVAIALNYCACF